MSVHTASQVEAEHISKLGADLGPIYHALWNELAWVNSKWTEYVALFGTKESRIELLNRAAGRFFGVIQISLWEDTILHIARLMDSPKTMGKSNLTMKQLPLLISDNELKSEVHELLNIAEEKTEFCRENRNRRLAHKDLQTVLGNGAEPITPGSRVMVKDALSSLSDILNAVSRHYLDTTTCYFFDRSPNGAESLLYVIDEGLRSENYRKQRIRDGKYTMEDFEHKAL